MGYEVYCVTLHTCYCDDFVSAVNRTVYIIVIVCAVVCLHAFISIMLTVLEYCLGFRAVLAFHSSNTTYILSPASGRETPGDKVYGLIKILQCKMRRGSISECHIELPVQFTKKETASAINLPVKLENVAWVSCTGEALGENSFEWLFL